MKQSLKKLMWGCCIVVAVFIVGGIGSIVIDKYIIPKFADSKIFGNLSFLKKASENTTIINRTEQIIVREDDSVEKITSQAMTAVVKIVSVQNSSIDGGESALQHNPTFATGSGVLVTNDGFVVTYRKTILEKDAQYTVILFNGTTHTAQLEGIDPLTNLAYLKIQADNVPAISLANSNDMRPGKKLVALAASTQPYQGNFSMSMLNSLDKTFNLSEKTVASSEKFEGVLHVDFSGQQEYVGGPVINYSGEMVGMLAFTETDGKRHYFALPSSSIKSSLETVLRGGLLTRPVFGIYYLSITKELAIAYQLKSDHGALVFSPSGKSGLALIAGSPAEAAQLLVNDIILAVNDKEINLDNPLSVMLAQFSKGETIQLTIMRKGEEKKIEVKL